MKKNPVKQDPATKAPQKQTIVSKNLATRNRIVEICSMAAVALIALIFVILSVASILQTCRISTENPTAELILYENDSIPVNLALILITLIAAIALMRRNIHLSNVNTRFILFIMLAVTTIIPLIWITLTQTIATGDAQRLLSTARGAAQDNYSGLTSSYAYGYTFYQYYPDRLGYVFFAEFMYRIFGVNASDLVVQIPNVIALDFAYAGVVMITSRIFRRKSITNLTAIALMVCLQPMFMTTFANGTLIGLAFAVWSIFFTIRYMQDNKLWLAGIAALLITLSVVIQSRFYIVLVALCVALVLHTIGTMRFLALATGAVMVLCSFGAPKLIGQIYSGRSGTDVGPGITYTQDRYLGIGESSMAPGWFNWNAIKALSDQRMDTSRADRAAEEGIDARLKTLSDQNQLTSFFKQKFLSQFNEPFFQSVWISHVADHQYSHEQDAQAPKLVTSVYTGGMSILLDRWFNYFTMIVYVGFAAGMAWMLIRRKLNPSAIILPVTVLGGIFYLMMTEAKSQYFLPFFVLLIPFAMYGVLESAGALKEKVGILFNKQKCDAEPAATE